jgi:hypothetical protein
MTSPHRHCANLASYYQIEKAAHACTFVNPFCATNTFILVNQNDVIGLPSKW